MNTSQVSCMLPPLPSTTGLGDATIVAQTYLLCYRSCDMQQLLHIHPRTTTPTRRGMYEQRTMLASRPGECARVRWRAGRTTIHDMDGSQGNGMDALARDANSWGYPTGTARSEGGATQAYPTCATEPA